MYCLKSRTEKTDSMFRLSICFTVLTLLTIEGAALAQFESVRREYDSAGKNDPVTKLQKQIESGKVNLQFDEQQGYLRSVLKALDVSPSSQTLVFSQTSFQRRRISPRPAPRRRFLHPRTGGHRTAQLRARPWQLPDLSRVVADSKRPGASCTVGVSVAQWLPSLRRRHVSDPPPQSFEGTLGRLVRHRHARQNAAHGKCVFQEPTESRRHRP